MFVADAPWVDPHLDLDATGSRAAPGSTRFRDLPILLAELGSNSRCRGPTPWPWPQGQTELPCSRCEGDRPPKTGEARRFLSVFSDEQTGLPRREELRR
jgi:hypothetical protein